MNEPRRPMRPENETTPDRRSRWSGVVYYAEDTRFELVGGCPQHAFQFRVRPYAGVRWSLRCTSARDVREIYTPRTGLNCN